MLEQRHAQRVGLPFASYGRESCLADAMCPRPSDQRTAKGYFLSTVRCALADAGYPTMQLTLNAADFGVPQRRTRLFLVANRSGISIAPPVPRTKAVSVGEAIGDLPVLKNGASVDTLPYGLTPPSMYARQLP